MPFVYSGLKSVAYLAPIASQVNQTRILNCEAPLPK